MRLRALSHATSDLDAPGFLLENCGRRFGCYYLVACFKFPSEHNPAEPSGETGVLQLPQAVLDALPPEARQKFWIGNSR
jgi:hypothetical protein